MRRRRQMLLGGLLLMLIGGLSGALLEPRTAVWFVALAALATGVGLVLAAIVLQRRERSTGGD